ncbi:D-alanyl-D-alanine carboxypeptidase family protein [Actinocorallia longicatena]|uniref:D-alanyl-D-alanine carboxypeptidase family protein n=1 Tax=Actinocorallia longicatena TaxID=111803 RepID=UPI0031D4541E
MLKIVTAAAVALAPLTVPATASAAAVPPVPRVSAKAYVVADAGTGRILASRDQRGRYLPASVIKVLTSVTLIPKVKPSTRVRPNRQTVNVIPTKVGLRASRTYRADDLFRAMLLKSANDAAYALAQAGGGLKATISAMNAEARRLGATDTLAASPNGLDRDLGLSVRTQHTSARDLAVIMRQALKLPDFRRYAGTRRASFPGGGTLTNGNKLLASYPGMIAGKNGSTHLAGRTYVGAAQRGGHTIIVAELGGNSTLWKDSAALLDWGFKATGKTKGTGALPAPAAGASAPPASTPATEAVRLASSSTSSGSFPWPALLTAFAAGVLGLAFRKGLPRRKTRP